MKKTPGILLFCLSVLWCGTVYSQVNLKLNCLYAVAGVINPQAEFVLSNHSSMSLDVTYSPWRSINGRHANFGIFTGEYRYYVGRHRASGFYVSGHAGMMGFDISKPRMFSDGKFISFKDGYSKGFGVILGIGIGYQHEFCRRWVVDAFLGVYGACSTMAESLAVAAAFVNAGYCRTVVAATGSHFASAERQYRYPLELGTTRPPQSQWTVTGAGASEAV